MPTRSINLHQKTTEKKKTKQKFEKLYRNFIASLTESKWIEQEWIFRSSLGYYGPDQTLFFTCTEPNANKQEH